MQLFLQQPRVQQQQQEHTRITGSTEGHTGSSSSMKQWTKRGIADAVAVLPSGILSGRTVLLVVQQAALVMANAPFVCSYVLLEGGTARQFPTFAALRGKDYDPFGGPPGFSPDTDCTDADGINSPVKCGCHAAAPEIHLNHLGFVQDIVTVPGMLSLRTTCLNLGGHQASIRDSSWPSESGGCYASGCRCLQRLQGS